MRRHFREVGNPERRIESMERRERLNSQEIFDKLFVDDLPEIADLDDDDYIDLPEIAELDDDEASDWDKIIANCERNLKLYLAEN